MKESKVVMNEIPRHVIATMAALQEERGPLAARLDAIDLALDNLKRVWSVQAPRAKASKRVMRLVSADGSEAAERRGFLLSLIGKSPAGLTLGELRKQTPKMAGKDRSNALQILKVAKQIRRQGNAWVKAA